MVNILDKQGKLTRATISKSSIRQTRINELINESSINFITSKTNDIIGLQDLKNKLKQEQQDNNKPYGMHMIKNHANAQVRSDCLTMRANEKIHAKLIGTTRVIYYNHKLISEFIGQQKDSKVKAKLIERYKILQELPKKESYY